MEIPLGEDPMDFFVEERGPDGQGHDLGLVPASDGIHRDTDPEQRAVFMMARIDGQINDEGGAEDLLVEIDKEADPETLKLWAEK